MKRFIFTENCDCQVFCRLGALLLRIPGDDCSVSHMNQFSTTYHESSEVLQLNQWDLFLRAPTINESTKGKSLCKISTRWSWALCNIFWFIGPPYTQLLRSMPMNSGIVRSFVNRCNNNSVTVMDIDSWTWE